MLWDVAYLLQHHFDDAFEVALAEGLVVWIEDSSLNGAEEQLHPLVKNRSLI